MGLSASFLGSFGVTFRKDKPDPSLSDPGKRTATFHRAGWPLPRFPALYCRAPAFCRCLQQGHCWDWWHCTHRDTAGTGGIANTWKNEAGEDLQRKACKENARLCLNFWVVFVLSPSRCSLNWGTAAFPSLQSNSLVARAGTAWSAKQLKHQHLYSDCSDCSNPHAGHETGKKLKLVTHVGHGPI